MKDFESMDSDYITANYFKDVKPKLLNNILIVQEPDCDTDLVPRNLTLQRGADNVIAKIIVYVSKNADKLERLYNCVADQIKEDEIIFFLEYNSGNNNDQILYVRFGAEKLKNDLLGVSDTEMSEISPLFDANLFRELIANGKIKTRKTILGLLVKSFIGIGSVIFAIPKALGWVSSQIGKVISENLKIPERIWNSQSPDYFLDEMNLLKNLRIDPSFMNGLNALIVNDPTVAPIILLPVGGDLIKQNLGVVDSLVREYNIYIEERVEEWEGLKEASGFYITEEIAYLSGIWNGLVDFVADIFNFVGLVLETTYDLINNFQSFLNALRNLYESWHKFSFREFFITSLKLKLDIDKEVYKFLKSKNPRAEYNFDKLAYFSGYGIAFLASLLVPGSEFSQLASIAKATKFIPKGFLECLVQQSSKNIRGSQAFISFINEIATFLAKKGNELYTELKKIIDNIVKWFKGNKKEFELPPENIVNIQKMWDDFKYKDLFDTPPKKPCFLSGTIVKTEKGSQFIEGITIGQKIYAYNFDKKCSELKTVTQTFTNRADMYIRIITSNGVIEATGQHRFWIPDDNKWLMANSLSVGMRLLTAKYELVTIQTLEIITDSVKTYNLEVDEHHNYFVGIDEVLTHNKTRVSLFASTELIDVEFYIFKELNEPVYVGQTQQGIYVRAQQHEYEYKKNPSKKIWMKKRPALSHIILNELSELEPPYKMTPYEAAVTELYEINANGGTRKNNKGLYNKQKPIGRKKFDHFKELGIFNPCKFYV